MREKSHKIEKKRILGLRRKVMSVVCASVIVGMIIIIVTTTYNYVTSFEQKRINDISEQMERVEMETLFFQTLMDNVSKQIVADVTVQELLDNENDSTGIYLYKKHKINDLLASFAYVVDPIQEIMIYSAEGETYSSQSTTRSAFVPEDNSWYLDYKNKGQSSGFTNVHRSIAMTSGYSENVISYIMTFYDVNESHKEMGELIINIKYSYLESVLNTDNELVSGVSLYDSIGNAIYSQGEINSDYNQILEMSQGLGDGKQDDYILTSKTLKDGWILCMDISASKLNGEIWQALSEYIIAIIILGLIILFILQRFVEKIINPINKLTDSVVAVGNGNFNTKVEIHTNDEIELLADGFNHMVLDIQALMNESVENEKIKRKMTVDNLMNQINPHFIYNTLNSIVYMAKSGGNEDIVRFTNTFISLLQGTLKIQDSVYVLLQDELKNIENYLSLQQYRYADRFDFKIDCLPEYGQCLVPKVMLEPLVENAIFHGIAPSETYGHLNITVSHQDDLIKIMVADNGVGMDEESITRILTNEEIPRGGIHKIGIANVRKRIKQIYGEEYDIFIKSTLGEGTNISVELPYKCS